ncbi:MAG: hypothetical protein KBD36_01115 [Alphaproteobacteria bacterium]|nr:hypothetical protein [Alphaproteobacteria bacterium]
MHEIKKHQFSFRGLSIFSIIIGLICFSICSQSYASAFSEQPRTGRASSSPKMPFKLGFELQEISSLCKWAINNNLIQKKPIFIIKDHLDNELWHVELDSSDIEFVTSPFSHNQKESLRQCISSIFQSLFILTEMLKEKESVTFYQWMELVKGDLEREGYTLEQGDIIENVGEGHLHKPSVSWKPIFNPQVTIQHPLEFTIPLYFNLFGFDRPNYTMSFVASLPGVDKLKAAMKRGNGTAYQQILSLYTNKKVFGLAFLHALTLVQLTPDADANDSQLLKESVLAWRRSQQVDAKMKLPLLSRRPFSLMCRDINYEGNYANFFFAMFGQQANQSFFSGFAVPRLLDRANYGEQFFDGITGEYQDLSAFLPNFEEDFLENGNRIFLENLLKKGIVTTTMIRNSKEIIKVEGQSLADIFNQYYRRAIESVDVPEHSRLNLFPFSLSSWEYDVLSPPLLQDQDNAMGRYRDAMTSEEKLYGEAIVEIRAIKDVAELFLEDFFKRIFDSRILGEREALSQPALAQYCANIDKWLEEPLASSLLAEEGGEIFLKKLPQRLNEYVAKAAQKELGNYLREPDKWIAQSLALFDFLDNFGEKNFLDFSAGLPYAVLKGFF